MTGKLIGYARVSTDTQDLTAQRDQLLALGAERIYSDKGLTGTNRARPGLKEALAACWEGDTLVVTKLDRLARSARDARDIADELAAKGARLSFNGSTHDPADPMGRMVFGMLGVFAEFEADLIRARTKEGMKIAKQKGRLKGRQRTLKPAREEHLVALYRAGDHTVNELAEIFGVGRATVYRAVGRAAPDTAPALTLPRSD